MLGGFLMCYDTKYPNDSTMTYTAVKLFLIALTTLTVIHLLSLRFFIYWRYDWFDIPMHLFGGAVVALGIFAAYELGVPFAQRFFGFWPLLAAVLAVAIMWEVYEYVIGLSVLEEDFVVDTGIDLAMGLIGGVVGYFVGNSSTYYNV